MAESNKATASDAKLKLIEEQQLKDLKIKNYLYQAIDREILDTILNDDTSKNIWDSMKQKFQGSTQVKRAQLQALRGDFEMLHMKERETVNSYFARTLKIAKSMTLSFGTVDLVMISKNVVFEEQKGWNWEQNEEEYQYNILDWGEGEESVSDIEEQEQNEENAVDSSLGTSAPPNESHTNNYETPSEGRVRRNIIESIWMIDYKKREGLSDDDGLNVMMVIEDDPSSFKEAIKSKKWRNAIMKEMESIEKNKTWELTDLPREVKPIGVKWIFKTKFKENGEVDKFKARLVAKRQPTGFVKRDEEDKVYRLKKALYDLKQTLRAWYNKKKTFFSSNGIFICQRKYAHEILSWFGMKNYNAVKSSIAPKTRLSKDDVGNKVDPTMFKQVVGSLMYLTTTRPDLIYGVSLINRFMSSPTESHWFAAKRILRYLKGTTELGIYYKKGGNTSVVAYFDSDFAGDIDDRRSTYGFVFLLGSGAVSWSSKKQPVVTLSTTEAEYIATASCACQCIWIQKVLKKLGLKEQKNTRILCDNNSTIQLSKNPMFHGRSKHIDIKFHFLRDLVKDEIIKLSYCSSHIKVADIMTKPLKLEQFLKLRNMLGIVEASKLN
ncbi:hypothetical protein CR513_38687, partial [Mucuna pruriens]